MNKSNPLLNDGNIPLFEDISAEHVAPAIDEILAKCDIAIERAVMPGVITDYQSLSTALDLPVESLGAVWGTVMHLQGVCDSPALRAAIAQCQPKVTAFFTRLSNDLRLYEAYKRVRSSSSSLTEAQARRLDNNLRGFLLSGAELDDLSKSRFAETVQRSSELSRQYSNNVMDATDAYAYYASVEELDGVPADVIEAFAAAAAVEGRNEQFKVTLQQPSLIAILQFANNRELRERLYRANTMRASELDEPGRDNGPVVAEILSLRHERAALLGHTSHAVVSLIPKMADSPEQVLEFLRDLGARSRPHALDELGQLEAFAKELLGLDKLEVWDAGYVAEKLRQERYAFSERETKPYFQLEKVLEGLFKIAEGLFDIQFTPEELPRWHKSVRSYRIARNGELLGQLFFDPFARAGKRSGAWMSGARSRWRRPDGTLRTSVGYIVTNFAEPAPGRPALLGHGDVITLFHEFGHALHSLLTRVETIGVSGINGVEWDAVELPSQLLENFAWQWETLAQISAHVESGASLPRELFEKMVAAKNFQVGLGMLRQTEMAIFDMRAHAEPDRVNDIQGLANEVRREISVFKVPEYNRYQNCFSHIFSGGYAAGYYSYLWAEVLSADAWDEFERDGVMNPATGRRYLHSVLEVGGSRPMRQSFEEFVGRQPRIDALLRQRGLESPRVSRRLQLWRMEP